jgi:type II secretion system protein G
MNLLKKLRSRSGFTLVELIIVIMIIGILAATLLPKVMGAPGKARDAARTADLNALATALELYFADNNDYPPVATVTATGLSQYLVTNGYLKSNLVDPVDASAYVYVYCAATRNGVPDQAYALGTRLETSTGSQRTIGVGDPIITASANDTTKATVKTGSTVGTYAYGTSTCTDV